MFFTMMIYVPIFYNYISILLFVLVFPFYYAFISELIKALPGTGKSTGGLIKTLESNIKRNQNLLNTDSKTFFESIKHKIDEYLK